MRKAFCLQAGLLLVAASLIDSQAHAAVGELDTSFGSGGWANIAAGSGASYAGCKAVAGDSNKFVVACQYNVGGMTTYPWRFSLAGVSADGTLDTGFGTAGKVTTSFSSYNSFSSDIIRQSDGKLVVAGSTYLNADVASSVDFAVARYTAAGQLDTTFDGDGLVITPVGSGQDDGRSVIQQPDGKLVVAGMSMGPPGNYDFSVVRYNSNGSLDSTFGSGGKVITDVGGSTDQPLAVLLQPDGKLVVAGESYVGAYRDVALVRYHSNGSLDTTFDGDGKVTTSIGSGDDIGSAAVFQADGKLIVAGAYSPGGTGLSADADIALLRYNTDGSLDTSFSGDGKVALSSPGNNDGLAAVMQQADGKLVAGGYLGSHGGTSSAVIARWNADGTPDTGFSGDGRSVFSATYMSSYHSLIQLANGKLVAAGVLKSIVSSLPAILMARYDSGQVDSDGDGIVDWLDTDNDNDGVINTIEAMFDTDPNTADTFSNMKKDNDGDGMTEALEVSLGTSDESVDTDLDSLSDTLELIQYITNPLSADTDGDSIPDNIDPEPGLEACTMPLNGMYKGSVITEQTGR